LAARIDRLETEDKRLLQAASVMGKDVPFALLRAIAEGPEETLRQGLANLQAAEFLYEARLFPDLEYTFKHALTQEVAYGSILHEGRKALHGEIVRAIEQLYSDRLIEHVERLAHHTVRAALWRNALDYCQQAGLKLMERSAYREAVTYLEGALPVLGQLPETQTMGERAIDLRLDFRNALFALDDHERLRSHLRERWRLQSALVIVGALGASRRGCRSNTG
jgi:predicted ATPase